MRCQICGRSLREHEAHLLELGYGQTHIRCRSHTLCEQTFINRIGGTLRHYYLRANPHIAYRCWREARYPGPPPILLRSELPVTVPSPTHHYDTPESTVHVLFLIDASGSMGSRAADVRGGFNSYVESLRLDPRGGPYELSAVTFDTRATTLFANVTLDAVPALTEKNYRAGGNTALYDAVGTGLAELGRGQSRDRYVVIIMTDGEENSSTRYNKAQIRQMIESRTSDGNWTFVYLGADQDAWAAAGQLGVLQGNTMSYDGASTSTVFRQAAAATLDFAASNTASSTSFTTSLHD